MKSAKTSAAKTTSRQASRVSNAKLLKLAGTHRPPQTWFEQTDVPFIPQKG